MRLLELAGRTGCPVFLGRETPLSGSAEFPAEWRAHSDELPGVTLPEATRRRNAHAPTSISRSALLTRRVPCKFWRLAALTNLAEAFTRAAACRPHGSPDRDHGRRSPCIRKFRRWRNFKTNNTSSNGTFSGSGAAKIVFAPALPFDWFRWTRRNASPSTWRCSSNFSRGQDAAGPICVAGARARTATDSAGILFRMGSARGRGAGESGGGDISPHGHRNQR